jgi:hypothetical protein
VRTQNRVHAIAETGTCHRNTRKCRPQREHRQGWRSQWRVRSITFRMPTVRKSIDLQRGHCARNSTSPATIMIESLLSPRLCEQRVVPVGLQQHACAYSSCFLKCWTNSCHLLHVGCDASTISSPSTVCSFLTLLHKRLTYASASDNSQIIASVVSISDAIDAAFCSAVRVTFVGSITPDFTRSSY